MRAWVLLLLTSACAAGDGSNRQTTWGVDTCEPPVAQGYDEGDVLPDFALTDQHGDTVHLYDFCNRAVFVEVAGFF